MSKMVRIDDDIHERIEKLGEAGEITLFGIKMKTTLATNTLLGMALNHHDLLKSMQTQTVVGSSEDKKPYNYTPTVDMGEGIKMSTIGIPEGQLDADEIAYRKAKAEASFAIITDENYDAALTRAETLIDMDPSPEEIPALDKELRELADRIQAYETIKYPMSDDELVTMDTTVNEFAAAPQGLVKHSEFIRNTVIPKFEKERDEKLEYCQDPEEISIISSDYAEKISAAWVDYHNERLHER